MSVSILTVKTKADLGKFIDFPENLYKDCENFVPALRGDEYDSFNPKKNGAYDFCDAECYLAYRGNEVVGRVAAIINHKANELWKDQCVRFGWLDFIEDEEVLKALLDKVAEFGKARGCSTIKGPLGFTDMDKEGLLIEGYENLSPFTCLYNYPYYDTLLTKLGYEKDVDWTQKTAEISEKLPFMFQMVPAIEERFGIHVYRGRSMREMCRKYGMAIFHMYNDAFAPLFQFTPLTDKQIRSYLDTYIPILDKDYVAVCVNNDDEPVGFAFCVPSLSKAVKKSGGRLLPFGIFRILRALRKNDTLESLMIGVRPDYQGKGVTVLMFDYIHRNCLRRGVKTMIMNPELEENFKVQSLFNEYKTSPYMRRRAYKKSL